jgi:phosphatidylserine/phosphatidylglycerophosphate/cardiolipin synthase-like enzyme
VIEQPELAHVFEAFILNDLTQASAHNVGSADAQLQPARIGDQAETPPFARFFPSTSVSAKMTITPLLTPDPGVYADAVRALIDGAGSTLYLQFQYIELPRTVTDSAQPFIDLVQAVVARQKAGVDVRIIMSEYEVAGYLEQLATAGLDVKNGVKIQNNVHNKGVVVDGATVLVSSQNWSMDGTLFNRDAGVVIANSDIAQYFQRVFLHDWAHLAKSTVASD